MALALTGALALWAWPQMPRWGMVIPNPEQNRNKLQLLFFSSDSGRVYFTERDKENRQASVVQYDARTGRFLERVELWRDGQPDPQMEAGAVPMHFHRSLMRTVTGPGGGRIATFYDAVHGRIECGPLPEIDQVYYGLSRNQQWFHYYGMNKRPEDRPGLFIANVKTGEVVLHCRPESEPVSDSMLSYGWDAVFDPTERYVALAWNSYSWV